MTNCCSCCNCCAASSYKEDKPKIRTDFAKIIIDNFNHKPYYAIKPYYCIMWYDHEDKSYQIGYGSYNFDYVVEWLDEEFEIISSEEFRSEVKANEQIRCKENRS